MKNRSESAIRILSIFLAKYHSPGDATCGGSPANQCTGLFDPPNRINNHYHSEAAAEFLSNGDPSGGKYRSSLPLPTGHVGLSVPRWTPVIFIHEDNTTCIIAYTTGKNPIMKDLERCFGVSLAWGHQRMMSGDYIMVHTRSHDNSADIYTKGFLNKTLFRRLKVLTNMYTQEELDKGWLNPPALNDNAP